MAPLWDAVRILQSGLRDAAGELQALSSSLTNVHQAQVREELTEGADIWSSYEGKPHGGHQYRGSLISPIFTIPFPSATALLQNDSRCKSNSDRASIIATIRKVRTYDLGCRLGLGVQKHWP